MAKTTLSLAAIKWMLTKMKSQGDHAALCNSNSTTLTTKTVTALSNYKKLLVTLEDASKNIFTSIEVPVALFKAKSSISLRFYQSVQSCPTGVVTYVSNTSIKLQIANYTGTDYYVYVYGVK